MFYELGSDAAAEGHTHTHVVFYTHTHVVYFEYLAIFSGARRHAGNTQLGAQKAADEHATKLRCIAFDLALKVAAILHVPGSAHVDNVTR